MTSAIVSLTLALAAAATGWGEPTCSCGNPTGPHHHHPGFAAGHGQPGGFLAPGGRIVAPGPGDGWGFPNGNPDGYGWWDHGCALPLGANRTPEYYFPRYFSVPPPQMWLQSYYNPYLTRGQRYIAFTNCGGVHPAGGPPQGTAVLPPNPYRETIGTGPKVELPGFSGRSEAPVVPPGSSGLTP